MFDLGFIKDIRYVLRRLPPRDQRQSLMFSATLGQRVLELAYEHMNEPELLQVETDQVTADNVQQSVYYPANKEKLPLLVKILRGIEHDVKGGGRVMVFANTRVATDLVERTLNANGIHAAAMSGQVPQKKRQTLLKRFHDGEIPVLVATDVAARGLHIPDVTHVINFDLPQDAEDYVHRIGRTARLGACGEAISFACENYAFHLPEIEQYIGYPIPMEYADAESLPEIKRAAPAPKRERRGSGRGHSGSGRGQRPAGQHNRAGRSQAGSGDQPARRRRRRKPKATASE
jgi:ATP-dependent RNA helicase RhlB